LAKIAENCDHNIDPQFYWIVRRESELGRLVTGLELDGDRVSIL
jgi:hypothetical protein